MNLLKLAFTTLPILVLFDYLKRVSEIILVVGISLEG